MLNMNKVIQHIWNEIRAVNTEALTPVFDKENPIRSSSNVRTWWTSKPCEAFDKSHINFVVCDSKWEYLEAKTINESEVVNSFVKNDHLNFVVYYNYQGVVRRYFPDFIIKLKSGENLIIETKGQDTDQNRTKRAYLDEWCRAVNQHGGFGKWSWSVSFDPNDLQQILQNSALSFSGHIFADTEDFGKAEKLFETTKALFELFGFETSEEGKIKQGSWFKENVVYKIRNVFRSKEAKELFDKGKKALELALIDEVQSEVNRNNMGAVSDFINATRDFPNASVVMDTLVILKVTVNGIPELAVFKLTTEQLIELNRTPELKNNPLELLRLINNTVGDNKRLN
ncbi:MAG: hypothetical protein COZ08_06415 [Bacteroidetes bacterium CG_4_10_14_3_um_filter_42_6]|nr:MAG: hypothetical protein COZ08_06415 [Bacteroidetes bacterium CG_4_10_14_3_um_filter_42_6]